MRATTRFERLSRPAVSAQPGALANFVVEAFPIRRQGLITATAEPGDDPLDGVGSGFPLLRWNFRVQPCLYVGYIRFYHFLVSYTIIEMTLSQGAGHGDGEKNLNNPTAP
jgi:hypothetical protein